MTELGSMPNSRIAYVIDNLLRAGTQTALLYLIEGLSARGYSQKVFCLNHRFDPGFIEALEAHGAEVVVFKKGQLFTPAGWRMLYRAFQEVDIVQTFLPFSDIIGRVFGKLARVPVIVTSIRARNIYKKPWQLLLDRLTMSWADRVVFNAANVVEYSCRHEGVRPEQAVFIPNGVRFRASKGPEKSIFEGIIPADATIIGSVGRLRRQKGVDVLLDAFSGLNNENVHLVVVGDGELRDQLESQADRMGIQERTHFLGLRSDLPELYAAFHVYAHASRFEGMPNAVMEAMSAGLPVVATAADGTSELVEDGTTGWLVPVDDAAALGEKLDYVLKNPDVASEAGSAAAALMREKYSVQKMIEAFDRLYTDLLKSADRV